MQDKLEMLKQLVSAGKGLDSADLMHNLVVLLNQKKVDQKISSFKDVKVTDLMTSSYDVKRNYVKKICSPFFQDQMKVKTRRAKVKSVKTKI